MAAPYRRRRIDTIGPSIEALPAEKPRATTRPRPEETGEASMAESARKPSCRPRRVAAATRTVLLASVALTAGALAAAAAELPLKRVVLSTAGLAQFTHAGPVAGAGTLDLPVRLDQVDDILKSLTVFDTLGSVGTVSLPGREPLDQLFRDLPFGRDALGSPAELLGALIGSEVEIKGPVDARGRILSVDDETV
jgi:hypothetical protein